MSNNISVIENLLISTSQPLSRDDIVSKTQVGRSSITSAINRIARRRKDLVRVNIKGRSHYVIGLEKVAMLPEVEGRRAVRDNTGRFVRVSATGQIVSNPPVTPRRRSIGAGANQLELTTPQATSGTLSTSRLLPVCTPVTLNPLNNQTNLTSVETTLASAAPHTEVDLSTPDTTTEMTDTEAADPETSAHDTVDTDNAWSARSLEFKEDLEEFEKQEAAVLARRKARVAQQGMPAERMQTAMHVAPGLRVQDLFRGWINPDTGVQAARLGLGT